MVIVTVGGASFVLFSYGDIQWGSGSFVGFTSNVTIFIVPGSGRPAILEIEDFTNVGITGVYAYRVDQERIEDPSYNFKGRLNIHTNVNMLTKIVTCQSLYKTYCQSYNNIELYVYFLTIMLHFW